MKYVLIILSSFLILGLIQSCNESSLDHGSDFSQWEQTNKDTNATFDDTTESQYAVKKTEYSDFSETMNFEDTRMVWNYDILRSIVKIDTSGKKPIIWLDLEFENPKVEGTESWHVERIKSFRMKFRGDLDDALFVLDGKENSGKWFEITITEIATQNETSFSYPDIEPVVSILEIDEDEGTIRGLIQVDIEEASNYMKRFRGEFKVFYRNNP